MFFFAVLKIYNIEHFFSETKTKINEIIDINSYL